MSTRKNLMISMACLVLTLALLAGTTFAWFTDSVVSSGNKIEAGSLSIDATAFDLAESGETGFAIEGVNGGEPFYFEENGQNLKAEDAGPIINEQNWEPGSSSAKLLQVTNAGTLAAKITLDFRTEGGLTDALWFDFVQVQDGQITGTFTRRPMNTLSTFAAGLELPLLKTGDTVQFILVYGMNKDAGNTYGGESFTADVTILAKQAAYEEDGFGNNDYDAGATYPVSNIAAMKDAIAQAQDGDTIQLANDLVATDEIAFAFNSEKQLTLDLNGQTLTYHNPQGSGTLVQVTNGASLTLRNGTIEMDNPYYGLVVASNSTLRLEQVTVNSGDGCVFSQGRNTTVEVIGCTLSSAYYAVYHNGSYAPADITIRDTEIRSGGVYVSNSAGRERQKLTVEDSVICGPTAIEIKHTDATIINSKLIGTATPTGSGSNNNGGCTEGYALAVTGNGVEDLATGTVVVSGCEFYSGAIGSGSNGYYFVYKLAEGASVTINGQTVNDFNSYEKDYIGG